MIVVKVSAEKAKAIRAQKAVFVRSGEGRMAPIESQKAISQMMIRAAESL